MKKLFKAIKEFTYVVTSRVPYIPNFSNPEIIVKILLVSFFLCVIYTFSQINSVFDFYNKFLSNAQVFTPYVMFQLLLLLFFSKIVLKLKPINSIMVLIALNFVSVFVINLFFSYLLTKKFNWIESNFPTFFVSFGILFLFLIYFDWREKNVDPANTMSKLIFLQSKMRPHFLFNTINSVISLLKKDPDVAKKMLINLSFLLREIIKDDNKTLWSIGEELEICRRYLEIEKIRFGKRLQYAINIDPVLLSEKIPRLILQPLVENSVLHGIQNIKSGGMIKIDIMSSGDDFLQIEIKNPINKNKESNLKIESNNISIKNIKERLKIFYNGDVFFTVKETDIFTIIFIIPKKTIVNM